MAVCEHVMYEDVHIIMHRKEGRKEEESRES